MALVHFHFQRPQVHCLACLACLVLWVASAAGVFRPSASFAPQQSSGFWVSPNGTFTFGFKKVGNDEYVLCIWVSQDGNQTAVWWAGFAQDSVANSGALLNFSSSGELQLLDTNSAALLWSSGTRLDVNDSSSASKQVEAQLMDSGNLRVVAMSSDNLSIDILWQSFDNLANTLLLPTENGEGLNISAQLADPGRGSFLQSKTSSTSYASGDFHLQLTSGYNLLLQQFIPKYNYNFTYWYGQINTTTDNVEIQEDNELGPMYDNNRQQAGIKRLTVGFNGWMQIFLWTNSGSWERLWTAVDYVCPIGSPCGAFGLCSSSGSSVDYTCICPPGFDAIDSLDPSQGCQSELSFNATCSINVTDQHYNKTMVMLAGYDYNQDDLLPWADTPVVEADACVRLCMDNCSCIAAAYNVGSKQCFLKGNSRTGVLLDGSSDGDNNLYIKLVTFAAGEGDSGRHPHGKVVVASFATIAAAFLALALGYCGYWLWRRRYGPAAGGSGPDGGSVTLGAPTPFTYAAIQSATKNFNEPLGKGAFGKVYKGWLGSAAGDEQAVAVKVLSEAHSEASETKQQFRAEVSVLGKVHHVNLVKLIGFCAEHGRYLLVYEYVEGGSLDQHLRGSDEVAPAHVEVSTASGRTLSEASSSATSLEPIMTPELAWSTRFSIAVKTARGISYLHHDCSETIIHCDIKPQNILLDVEFSPKVADLGLACQFHRRDSHLTFSRIRGTRGYLAPEWWLSNEPITTKADVYSFGVVLLEVARGLCNDLRKDQLIQWAFQRVDNGQQKTTEEATEEELQQLRVLRTGLWCIQRDPSSRPSMSEVEQMLTGVVPVNLPPFPSIVQPVANPHADAASFTVAQDSSCVVSGR